MSQQKSPSPLPKTSQGARGIKTTDSTSESAQTVSPAPQNDFVVMTQAITSIAARMGELSEMFKGLKEKVEDIEKEKKKEEKSDGDDDEKDESDFDYSDAFKDDDDGDADFIFDLKDVTKNDRRATIYERSAEQIKTVAQPLTFHASQPTHNIALTALTVRQVFNFFEELEEYQTVWSIRLQAPRLISPKVRERLVARYPHKLRGSRFFELNDVSLYRLVAEFVRPESKTDFIVLLERNVDFEIKSSYRPSAENFRVLYDAILAYRYNFLKTYELLARRNSKNIPDCKNKPNGLIKCFIQKIPFQYGDKVLSNFANDKFTKIYDFLATFSKTLEEHLKGHKKALQIVRCFGGTSYEAKKAQPDSLNHIEELEEDVIQRARFEDDVYDDEEEADLVLDPKADANSEDADEAAFEQGLAAMQDSQQPCWAKAMHDKCNRPNCTYDHGQAAMMRQRQTFMDQLRKLMHPQPKVGVSNSHPKYPSKN